MIFVTVGTHEQQFERLIKKIDELKKRNIIKEKVFIQKGFSNYVPESCQWEKFIPYTEMIEKVREAHIVITHGGPASFLMPLQEHKIPIVVPRKVEFHEHINDHQVEFVKFIEERQKNIIPVYDIENIEDIIVNYDQYIQKINKEISSNNKVFNQKFEQIVNNLLNEENSR